MRALVAASSATLLVLQCVFFRYYHVFLDDDGAAAASHMWLDVRPVLIRLLPLALALALAVAAIEYGVLSLATRLGKRARITAVAAFALSLPFLPHLRDASPDLSALSSARVVLQSREAHAAADVHVEPLATRRLRIPNVLLILDESVRATDYSTETTPQTSALTRGRVDLQEMRSVASYTAIAVSSLLTSLPPTTRESELKSAPYLFDFVGAVRRVGQRVHVAYLSAQNDSLFERRDVRAATDVFVTVDDLVGHRVEDIDDVIDLGVDRLLAERTERELAKLDKPLFAMVHLSGTHAPYFVDDERAPYKPYAHGASWTGLPKLHAAYRDAIFEQDASVARVLKAFFAKVGDEPSLVVFTSDHGEAFGEHAAIHHGQSLYDEQIHVPAWILARNGALSPAEVGALEGHSSAFVTHLDVLPTVLDAYGVLDSLAMQSYASRFAGQSLLRAGDERTAVVPLTNCTDMFPCPVRTWGVLSGERVLVAQPWDVMWRCVDLRTELEQPSDPACALLRDSSRAYFPTLPNGTPN